MTDFSHLDALCVNCGGRYGLHNYHNKRCPKDINATGDHTEYRNTVFKGLELHHPNRDGKLQILIDALRDIDLYSDVADPPFKPKQFGDIARKALAQYSTPTAPADSDPMALPEQYKTDDPIKAAVYFGWYQGLVNGHSHKFTWEQYEKLHPLSAKPPADEIEGSMSEGDGVCHKCRKPNPIWSAENDLFNKVNGSPNGIMCPTCFGEMAAEKGIDVYFRATSKITP